MKKIKTFLKTSEDDIRLVLNSTAEGIYSIDMNGKCTFCNASCLKLLKYTHETELLGKNMHRQIHNKHADGTGFPIEDCQIFKVIHKGEGIHVEGEMFWRSDGTCFPVEYYSYPQFRNGKVIGAVITFSDITERILVQNQIIKANKDLESVNKQLQEKQYSLEEQNAVIEELNSQLEDDNERSQQQKETLQAIIDSLGAGIVMVDTEGRITFINEAWKELFSYIDISSNYNIDGNFYINDNACLNTDQFIRNMTIGVENRENISASLINLLGDRETRYSVDMEQISPAKRFLSLYSNPCISYNGHVFGRVFVVRDISHQKEVDRLKMELISTVSHELRTPMSSILGFSELLLTRRLSEERNQEYISIINSEARRLTDLINDFLDIQRMESGKQVFNRQFNSLDEIIREAVKLFANAGEKYPIIYVNSIEPLSDIYCDKNKILQVMSNILSNAIKYSPHGGEIKIALSQVEGSVKVSITDQGLGIPEDAIGKLFTKFFRIDNDDRRTIGGTGLGLAICKEIIKAHGGDIGVQSVYGQGSTFYFQLPYTFGNKNPKPEREINTQITHNKSRLLIVEDDLPFVRLIKEILKAEELEMHNASSGEEALQLIGKYSFQLIILDIALGGKLNGWDVLKELKNNQATANIPIIISSVYENKSMASQNGIKDYLVKPFEAEELIKTVHKALNGSLKSKMMVNCDISLTEAIYEILKSRGMGVKDIESAGNILVITLEGEDGFDGKR